MSNDFILTYDFKKIVIKKLKPKNLIKTQTMKTFELFSTNYCLTCYPTVKYHLKKIMNQHYY